MPRAAIYLIVWRVGSLSYTPRAGICLVERLVGSLSYMPRSGICLVVRRVGSLNTCPVLESLSSISGWGYSSKRPVL